MLSSDHLAECDKLRKDGFRSSQYYSQGPTFSDPTQSVSSLQEDEEDDIDKKVRRTEFTVRKQDCHDGHSKTLPSSGYWRKCNQLYSERYF